MHLQGGAKHWTNSYKRKIQFVQIKPKTSHSILYNY
jgi:hypothetical protein